MAAGVLTFNDDLERFWKARLLAILSPKVGDGLFEGQPDASFPVGVGVEVSDADFLLLAAAPVDEKNGVAQFEFGFQRDKSAAGIDNDRFRIFVECSLFAGKSINHDADAHGNALAGAR